MPNVRRFLEGGAGRYRSGLAIASGLSIFSVLTAIGAARFVVWLTRGWEAWFFTPVAAVLFFLFLNGLEYALAQEGDDEG